MVATAVGVAILLAPVALLEQVPTMAARAAAVAPADLDGAILARPVPRVLVRPAGTAVMADVAL